MLARFTLPMGPPISVIFFTLSGLARKWYIREFEEQTGEAPYQVRMGAVFAMEISEEIGRQFMTGEEFGQIYEFNGIRCELDRFVLCDQAYLRSQEEYVKLNMLEAIRNNVMILEDALKTRK